MNENLKKKEKMSCSLQKLISVLPTESLTLKTKIKQYVEETRNRKFYVKLPRYYHSDAADQLNEKEFSLITQYIKKKYPFIYENSKHGDFIENGTLSGHCSDGVYIIDRKNNSFKVRDIAIKPDPYGNIPLDFVGFRDFIPGYQFELIEDKKCKSKWTNMLCPVDLDFLRNQKIVNFTFTELAKYSSFEYKNKKILILYSSDYSLDSDKKIEYFDMEWIEHFMDYYEIEDEISDMIVEFSKKFDIVLMPMLQYSDGADYEDNDEYKYLPEFKYYSDDDFEDDSDDDSKDNSDDSDDSDDDSNDSDDNEDSEDDWEDIDD